MIPQRTDLVDSVAKKLVSINMNVEQEPRYANGDRYDEKTADKRTDALGFRIRSSTDNCSYGVIKPNGEVTLEVHYHDCSTLDSHKKIPTVLENYLRLTRHLKNLKIPFYKDSTLETAVTDCNN